MEIQDRVMAELGLEKSTVNSPSVCCYTRDLTQVSKGNPVLVLLHGYPQCAYMWRLLIPLLPPSYPLFAPDLPGYGQSAPPTKNDKIHVGTAVLEALKELLARAGTPDPNGDVPIVLIGHDRGARIAHALAVSGFSGFDILGAALMDIAPTSEQWRAMGDSRANVGFFHWPFLANEEFATDMIVAYGGDKFCVRMIERWAGNSDGGLQSLKSGDAFRVYGEFFKKEQVIKASCGDYGSGAREDVDLQLKNQQEGKKLNVPVLLVYGDGFIGKRFDMRRVWGNWIDDSTALTVHGIPHGIGHFVAEEAPKETAEAVKAWLKKIQ